MPYDPAKHHRKSIRLEGYDYAQENAYFITIVVQDRACLLGNISDGQIELSQAGQMIEKWWHELGQKYPVIQAGEHVVMPNHIHGIIGIKGVGADLCVRPPSPDQDTRPPVGADLRVRPPSPDQDTRPPVGADLRVRPPRGDGVSLPVILQWFKTMTTNEYIREVKQSGWTPFHGKLWQRNYYEHIIRNAVEYADVVQYIETNPLNWAIDQEYHA